MNSARPDFVSIPLYHGAAVARAVPSPLAGDLRLLRLLPQGSH